MSVSTFRLAVLADVHGNLPALEAVLADCREQGVDAIASAGDLTSGVWVEEVVARVQELARWSIAGNHERYYTDLHAGTVPPSRLTGRQWAAQRWCYDRLSEQTLTGLALLPEQTIIRVNGADPIRLLHGAPSGIADRLYPDRDAAALAQFRRSGMLPEDRPELSKAIAGVAEPVIVCGHTHIPWIEAQAGRLVVSAGAVGGGNNGDIRATYAILTWEGGRWRAEHRAVPYNLDRVQEGFVASGYLAEGGAFALAILRNVLSGQCWPMALLNHVYGAARARGWEDTGHLPDDLWDEGTATFDWETYPEPETRTQR